MKEGRHELNTHKRDVRANAPDTCCATRLHTPNPWLARMNPSGAPVDFGGVTTNGGCRLVQEGDALVVIPLPDSPAFDLALRLDEIPFGPDAVARVECELLNGARTDHPFRVEGGRVLLRCAPGAFAYRLL